MSIIENKFHRLKPIDFLIAILPSIVKSIIYRSKGMRIGKNVFFRFGSVVRFNLECEIGSGSVLGFFSVVVADSIIIKKGVNVGPFSIIKAYNVSLGSYAYVHQGVKVSPGRYTKRSKFSLGENSIVLQNTMINCSLPVEIGCRTGIGGNSFIFTHAYWLDYLQGFPRVKGPVVIGDDCWIAWHTFIHPNTRIESRSIASATSVLSGQYGESTLIGNAPSRPIPNPYKEPISLEDRMLRFSEIIEEFNYLFEENGGTVSDHVYFLQNERVGELHVVSSKNWIVKNNVQPDDICYVFLDNRDGMDLACCCENIIDYSSYSYKVATPFFEDFVFFLTSYGIKLNRIDE
jgi:acetyltransferase-like isoleucine patch superfamily enzyme